MENRWRFIIPVLVTFCFVILFCNVLQLTNEKKVDLPQMKRYLQIVRTKQKSHCKGLRRLKQLLLAVNYNFPHYSSVPMLKQFYGGLFGKVIFCGADKHPDVTVINEHNGYQGYECVATGIRMFPNYKGFLYINDDVVLNWWTVINFDPSKIWLGSISLSQFKEGHIFGDPNLPNWYWWRGEDTAHRCEVAFEDIAKFSTTKEGRRLNMPTYLKRYYVNTGGRKICSNGWSDVFYIPKAYSEVFAKLSGIYAKRVVFLEVAVPGVLSFILDKTNYQDLDGMYYYSKYFGTPKYNTGEAFFETYRLNLTFSHPFKFEKGMIGANVNFFKNVVMSYGATVKRYCMLNCSSRSS